MIFAPTIAIHADTELFTFTSENRSLHFEPSLCLSSDNKILAVGERMESLDSKYVHLFHQPIQEFNYSELLEAFLRHGVSMTFQKSIMRRPKFRFIVSHCFIEYTHGYYDGILRSAALQAGAANDADIKVSPEAEQGAAANP